MRCMRERRGHATDFPSWLWSRDIAVTCSALYATMTPWTKIILLFSFIVLYCVSDQSSHLKTTYTVPYINLKTAAENQVNNRWITHIDLHLPYPVHINKILHFQTFPVWDLSERATTILKANKAKTAQQVQILHKGPILHLQNLQKQWDWFISLIRTLCLCSLHNARHNMLHENSYLHNTYFPLNISPINHWILVKLSIKAEGCTSSDTEALWCGGGCTFGDNAKHVKTNCFVLQWPTERLSTLTTLSLQTPSVTMCWPSKLVVSMCLRLMKTNF